MRKRSSLFLVIFLLLFSCEKDTPKEEMEVTSSINLNKGDSLVMVKFHESMGGLGWNLKDCRTWDCVAFKYDEATKQSYVSRIGFAIGYLKKPGIVPKEIAQLSKLEWLIIQDIHGYVNFDVPEELFNCPLETLRLEGRAIRGQFTPAVAKIAKTIQVFYIQATSMNGQLPEEFGLFQNLVFALYLSNNLFSGYLPKTFNQVSTGVNLSYNNISSVDWSFFDLDVEKSHQVLMHNNQLYGTIPDEVFNKPSWIKWHTDFGNQKLGYGFKNFANLNIP